MPERSDIAKDGHAEHIESLRDLIDGYLAGLVRSTRPASLYEPIARVLSSRGKRLRPLLTLLTAEAFGAQSGQSLPAAAAVEVFHNFTLVHDDIMDQSDSRRGQPTVHVEWGEPAAILSGDLMMGMSYALLARLPDGSVQAALACFSNMVVKLCEGQALDAEFERSNDVTVTDYLDMVSRKTGALLVASLQLGGIVGSAKSEDLDALAEVGHHLGLAFQIQDDLLDLTAESASWGKPIGADLIMGKRAFPLLKAVEIEPADGDRWFRALMERGGIDSAGISEAKERMQRLGVLDATRSSILEEYHEALDALKPLERDVSLQGVRWIIERMRTRVR